MAKGRITSAGRMKSRPTMAPHSAVRQTPGMDRSAPDHRTVSVRVGASPIDETLQSELTWAPPNQLTHRHSPARSRR
jgi:hypothetical protein